MASTPNRTTIGSAAGKNSAVLVFAVSDRPLAGFIYQVNSSEHAAVTTPGALADYFETSTNRGVDRVS